METTIDTTKKTNLFSDVIEKNKGIIYKVAIAYCRNAEDRKDLVQEIIIQLWNHFEDYNEQYKYSTWMYRIALNVSISFYRKENRRKKISTPFSDTIINFPEVNIPDEMESGLHLLHQFISGLKELNKALMLLYLEEKSYKEMAEIIGISETNVATKIGRIKTILKQKFSLI